MKRNFFIYIFLLILIFIALIILWPNRWINIDVGSFHYHKLWEGPNLTEITNGRINNDLNFELGKDFAGSKEYKVKVAFEDSGEEEISDENKQKVLDNTVELLRKRFNEAGLKETEIRWIKGEENYYIEASVVKKEANTYKDIIFNKGVLEIWGEKAEPDPIEVGGDQTFSFEDYLKQSYEKIDIDVNTIKGSMTGEGEEDSFIKVALLDNQSSELSNAVNTYVGKAVIAVIDEKFIPIDGQDMGEQFQFYGQIRSIKLMGFQDIQEAELYSSVVKYGPLEVSFDIEEESEIEPVYGRDFLLRGLVVYIVLLLVFCVLMVVLYKQDGLVGALAVPLFSLFLLATLKVLPLIITIGYVYSLLAVFAVLTWIVFSIARKSYYKKKADRAWKWLYVRDESFTKRSLKLVLSLALFSILCIIILPWEGKNFAGVVFTGTVWIWILVEVYYRYFYELLGYIFGRENE